MDGVLGSKTIAVIKKWQKDNGLTPDGLVGAKTKVMMNVDTSSAPAIPGTISGCGNRTTGFSVSSGISCTGNISTTPVIPFSSSSSPAYNLGVATLQNGSRGEPVKELQRFLNDKLGLGLVMDGVLGSKTIAVIKKWQKDNGLTSDGLVGAKTKAMMNAQ